MFRAAETEETLPSAATDEQAEEGYQGPSQRTIHGHDEECESPAGYSSVKLYYYAALLPRRGPHIASHSVCPSVCPSVPCLFTLEPSYECTSKIEKLRFSIIGQRQPCGRVVSFVLFTFAGRIL